MTNGRRVMAHAIWLVLAASQSWAVLNCDQRPFEAGSDLEALYVKMSDAVAAFPRLEETLNSDLTLCLSDTLVAERGYYQPEGRRLVLASNMTPGLTLAVGVHELRHVQQYDVGSCPGLDLSMRAYANAVFAMEADASVTSLVVATFHRKQGRPEMWDALAAWPTQADIAARFAATFAKTLRIEDAATDAFSSWYEDAERRDRYYIAICANYLDQLDRDHLLPQYNSLSDGFFDDLCSLPDGNPYRCSRPAD